MSEPIDLYRGLMHQETGSQADSPLSPIVEVSMNILKEKGGYLLMDALKVIEQASLKPEAEVPSMNIGDLVKVHVRIKEGERERIQVFEGTVIAMKHGGIQETFTVRRISYGVGVERVFPLHSPNVAKVETVRYGKVRRAKLYYLRDRVGKAAKVKERLR